MNAITRVTAAGSAEATMSSREIADLTGKLHKNVLADINKLRLALGSGWAEISAEYQDRTGRTLPCIQLPKRETLILVSGYSVELRARIIDRWQELEKARAAPQGSLSDPAALRGLLLGYTERVIELEAKVEEQAPKVEAFDRFMDTDGSLTFQQASKALSR
jgi:phage regulator Rha-like protein